MSEYLEQLNLDFGAPAGNGYAVWQWERKAAIQKISEAWSIPLDCRVRLRLNGIDCEFVDELKIAEMPVKIDKRRPLRLRMGRHVFDSTEIESCVVAG